MRRSFGTGFSELEQVIYLAKLMAKKGPTIYIVWNGKGYDLTMHLSTAKARSPYMVVEGKDQKDA